MTAQINVMATAPVTRAAKRYDIVKCSVQFGAARDRDTYRFMCGDEDKGAFIDGGQTWTEARHGNLTERPAQCQPKSGWN